ncbi:MAG: hypothetical protein IIT39_13280 [Clostridia bacterium]|nr:hypothetical protein [Clostridia bacterium]
MSNVLNAVSYDEKVEAKKELAAKMQDDINKRQERLDKLNAEIEQMVNDKKKTVGGYVVDKMLGLTDEQKKLFLENFDTIVNKFKEENATVETDTSYENKETPYTSYDETETFEDEQTEEVEETADTIKEETVTEEDFEEDSTTSYSNSFYQQNRNFKRY